MFKQLKGRGQAVRAAIPQGNYAQGKKVGGIDHWANSAFASDAVRESIVPHETPSKTLDKQEDYHRQGFCRALKVNNVKNKFLSAIGQHYIWFKLALDGKLCLFSINWSKHMIHAFSYALKWWFQCKYLITFFFLAWL